MKRFPKMRKQKGAVENRENRRVTLYSLNIICTVLDFKFFIEVHRGYISAYQYHQWGRSPTATVLIQYLHPLSKRCSPHCCQLTDQLNYLRALTFKIFNFLNDAPTTQNPLYKFMGEQPTEKKDEEKVTVLQFPRRCDQQAEVGTLKEVSHET